MNTFISQMTEQAESREELRTEQNERAMHNNM